MTTGRQEKRRFHKESAAIMHGDLYKDNIKYDIIKHNMSEEGIIT